MEYEHEVSGQDNPDSNCVKGSIRAECSLDHAEKLLFLTITNSPDYHNDPKIAALLPLLQKLEYNQRMFLEHTPPN